MIPALVTLAVLIVGVGVGIWAASAVLASERKVAKSEERQRIASWLRSKAHRIADVAGDGDDATSREILCASGAYLDASIAVERNELGGERG